MRPQAEPRVVSAPLRSLRGQITLRFTRVQAPDATLFGAMTVVARRVGRGRVFTVNVALSVFAREAVG